MIRFISRIAPAVVALAVITGTAACGEKSAAGTDNAAAGGAPATASKTSAPPVKTATIPSDACGWIPAVEVEQVVGKLEGPPRVAGNECVYPLAQKSESFASLLELRREFRKGRDDDHDFHDVVKVSVDVNGAAVVGQLAMNAVGKMFAKALGQRLSDADTKDASPPGWDSVTGVPYTWIGLIGHISIAVFSPPEITDEKKMAVAARFRGRIPDLPFPPESTYQIPTFSRDPNPCDLLTVREAEAVLGTLVVDPYRAIEHTSHPYERGKACAYFTPGHRALVITPEWSDGATSFNLSRGLGALAGAVVPFEKAAIEGPWEKGQVDGTTGALLFLKGDRLLRVDYLTSATDRAGALKLAAQAMQRLAS